MEEAPSSDAYFLDNGASQIKASRASGGSTFYVPNCAIKPSKRGHSWIVGPKLVDVPLPVLAQESRPTDRGYVMRWELQKAIWDETFTLISTAVGSSDSESDSSYTSEGTEALETGVSGSWDSSSAKTAGTAGAAETAGHTGLSPEEALQHALPPSRPGYPPTFGQIDLLCTCPPYPPTMISEAYSFMALEHYGFRSFFRAPGFAYMPYHPALQETAVGLVLDMGASGCSVAAFAHNRIIEHSIFRTDAGGAMLDYLYAEALASRAADKTPFKNLRSRPKLLSVLRMNGLADVGECRVLETLAKRAAIVANHGRFSASRKPGGPKAEEIIAKTAAGEDPKGQEHNYDEESPGSLLCSRPTFCQVDLSSPDLSLPVRRDPNGQIVLSETPLSKRLMQNSTKTVPGMPPGTAGRAEASGAEVLPELTTATGVGGAPGLGQIGKKLADSATENPPTSPLPNKPKLLDPNSLGKFSLSLKYSEEAEDFVVVKNLTSELLEQGQTVQDLYTGGAGAIAQMEEATALPRAIFYPEEFGMPQKGIIDIVLECIRSLPPQIQDLAKKHVFCVGGLTYMKGLISTLSDALQSNGVDLTLVPDAGRAIVEAMRAFYGSSDYAGACLTREEYQERGIRSSIDPFM